MKHFKLAVILICVLGAQAEPDRTPRIINAHTAPHIVGYNAYVLYTNVASVGFFGGGTIISDKHVLTSAKIIEGYVRWDVGFGSNIFVELTTITSITASWHPEFDPNTSINDIGIITLPVSLVFTQNVYPVALPDLNTERTNRFPLENEEGTIVSYGYTTPNSIDHTDVLMRTFQRVIGDDDCEELYQNQLPEHFCARDNARLSNMCLGDVGAGFVTFVHGRPTVTGIVSYIREICGTAYPTGYSRVDYHREWIRNVTQL
ncbi:trypsin-1 [Aedes albopictus]|uniref:Peptidase S1 domain-containing protein n=1 Tax=Aedes albopictus TaxID=7160 RepID=A0ABM1ZS97_AEDAL|nr:trypsin-1-like [Aedes albopictus]KXJ73175.1 hypothetical protein RP20_CCG016337 [Aedes albopictus]